MSMPLQAVACQLDATAEQERITHLLRLFDAGAQRPPLQAVTNLLRAIQKAPPQGGRLPYILVDLREFTPKETAGLAGVGSTPAMPFAEWLIAWRAYGMVAAATGQLTSAQIGMHEAIVAEVVATNRTAGYSAEIGALYSYYMRCDHWKSVAPQHVRVSYAGNIGRSSTKPWLRTHADLRYAPRAPP